MHPHRRHAVVLVLVLGVVAFLAQLAGVGGTRAGHAPAVKRATLSTIVGGSVPDIGSTTLARTKVRAESGATVRMTATADLLVAKLAKGRVAQVVCGIRYSRDGDHGWSLGTPYETVQLKRRGSKDRVRIERSFNAPASDTYRMSVACHVSAPGRSASVTAVGSMRAALGLPAGAATPVE